MSNSALNGFIERVSRERNTDPMLVSGVITDFLRELHERIYKDGGYGHALPEILFQCRDEAVYHFCGILIESAGENEADFVGMVNESVARLDFRLKRFRAIVDKWKMEKEWEANDRLADPEPNSSSDLSIGGHSD